MTPKPFTIEITTPDETFDVIFWRSLQTDYAVVVFDEPHATVYPCDSSEEVRNVIQLYCHLRQFTIIRDYHHESRKGLMMMIERYV